MALHKEILPKILPHAVYAGTTEIIGCLLSAEAKVAVDDLLNMLQVYDCQGALIGEHPSVALTVFSYPRQCPIAEIQTARLDHRTYKQDTMGYRLQVPLVFV